MPHHYTSFPKSYGLQTFSEISNMSTASSVGVDENKEIVSDNGELIKSKQ